MGGTRKRAGLAPMMQRFVAEYLVDHNATAAYQRAGYKSTGHAAGAAASKLLIRADVQAAIQAATEEVTTAVKRAVQVDRSWVLRRLKRNARRAAQAEPVRDKQGNETGEYVYQGNVVNKALELIGKDIGMFADKSEVTIVNPVEIIEVGDSGPGDIGSTHLAAEAPSGPAAGLGQR